MFNSCRWFFCKISHVDEILQLSYIASYLMIYSLNSKSHFLWYSCLMAKSRNLQIVLHVQAVTVCKWTMSKEKTDINGICPPNLSWLNQGKKKKKELFVSLVDWCMAGEPEWECIIKPWPTEAREVSSDVSLANLTARQQPQGKHQQTGSVVYSQLNTDPAACLLLAFTPGWEIKPSHQPNTILFFTIAEKLVVHWTTH